MATDLPPLAIETQNDDEHPLETYLKSQRKAREQVAAQVRRLEDLAANGQSASVRNQASIDGIAVNGELAHMDAEHTAFLLRVFTQTAASGPATQVVLDTVQLNQDLAKEIVSKNRPKVILNIITSYLNGAIAVFNGKA